MHPLNGWAMMIGGNISELKIVVSLATDKVKQGVANVKTQMTSLKRSVDNATASIKPSFSKISKPIEDISTSTKEASFAMKMFGQGGASVANTLSVALSKINPQFGQMREGISAVGNSMKGLAKTSKGAMVAVGAAIAVIAAVAIAKVAKAMYQKMSELVAFAAPDEYKKATEGMNNAINKLKTSIGTVLVPIFSTLSKVIEVVADALTWFVEKVVAPYWGFISGMFGWMDAFDTSGVSSVSDTMSDASDSTGKMADDVKEMGKGLAGFDKLTVQAKSSTTDLGDANENKRNAEQYERVKASMAAGAELARQIKERIQGLIAPVQSAIGWVSRTITKIVKLISKIDLKKTYRELTSGLSTFSTKVRVGISNLNKAIGGAVTGWFTDIFNWLGSTANNIRSVIGNAVRTVGGWFTGIFNIDWGGVWNDLVNSFNRIVSTISGLFSGFFKIDWDGIFYGLRNAFTKAINFVVDQWNKFIPDVIGIDVFGNKIGINTGALHLDKLPELANGGVVNPNNPMPVIVGDNTKEKEAIAPVSTLEKMIDKSVRNALGRYDDQPSRQDITLNIDGRKLARITHNYNAIESRRRGATIARRVY